MIRNILGKIVSLLIKYNLFSNKDRFREGDYIVFNWKAKYGIPFCYKNEDGVKVVTRIVNYKNGSQCVEYDNLKSGDRSSADTFWLKGTRY